MHSNPPSFKQEVYELIRRYSPNAAEEFNTRFQPPARQQFTRSIEMADVNTFWRTQLGLVGPHTLRARCSLIDHISTTSWMELFERDIMPVVIKDWLLYLATN